MLKPSVTSLSCLIGILTLAACKADKKTDSAEGFFLKPVAFETLPGWRADDMKDLLPALARSCARIAKRAADEAFFSAMPYAGTNADWQAACAGMPMEPELAHQYFEAYFTPYEIWADVKNPQSREGLFTGYYEPLLKAVDVAITQDAAAPQGTPLYLRPDDLVTVDLGVFKPELKGQNITGRVTDGKLLPYYTRAEIESGVLAGKNFEILHVTDPVDAFFLHIQGSGQVVMPDGSIKRVGYAAQNGHKYVAIGKELIDAGYMQKEDVSMQSIRAWLEENPDKAQDLMNKNPSYIFFRPLEGDGPLGAEGIALTPLRSLAVDRKKIPYGAPVFLDVSAPDPAVDNTRIKRLMIAQDTGGAIRGTVRGDFFWGAGEAAAHNAGLMKSRGQAWILLPRSVAVPADVLWHADKNAASRGYNQ
jgi:membrane-bound lytic murein transglycosylase A